MSYSKYFAFDKYSPRAYATHTDSDYNIAEVLEAQCDICGDITLVLQMDNGEAGPYKACQVCIATLFETFVKGVMRNG